MTSRVIAEYSLHVRKDGTELLYRELPRPIGFNGGIRRGIHVDGGYYIPAHHVILLQLGNGKLVEETTIRCFAAPADPPAMYRIVCPRPRGEGWELHNGDSDKRAVWRRPQPTGERPIREHTDNDWK